MAGETPFNPSETETDFESQAVLLAIELAGTEVFGNTEKEGLRTCKEGYVQFQRENKDPGFSRENVPAEHKKLTQAFEQKIKELEELLKNNLTNDSTKIKPRNIGVLIAQLGKTKAVALIDNILPILTNLEEIRKDGTILRAKLRVAQETQKEAFTSAEMSILQSANFQGIKHSGDFLGSDSVADFLKSMKEAVESNFDSRKYLEAEYKRIGEWKFIEDEDARLAAVPAELGFLAGTASLDTLELALFIGDTEFVEKKLQREIDQLLNNNFESTRYGSLGEILATPAKGNYYGKTRLLTEKQWFDRQHAEQLLRIQNRLEELTAAK